MKREGGWNVQYAVFRRVCIFFASRHGGGWGFSPFWGLANSKKKKSKEGSLEIKNLNEHFEEVKSKLQVEVFKEELKKLLEKKKGKIEIRKKEGKDGRRKAQLFVLNFWGHLVPKRFPL